MAEAQAQQAQQQAQDPIIQMQQKELELQEAEIKRKQQKDMVDAVTKADEIRLREKDIEQKGEIEAARLILSMQNKTGGQNPPSKKGDR
jgi:hypothetical protein